MRTGPRPKVLVTSGTGFIGRLAAAPPRRQGAEAAAAAGDPGRSVAGARIPMEHVLLAPGGLPAVIVDISAARALGFPPQHDLKSRIATIWPAFAPAAAEGNTAP